MFFETNLIVVECKQQQRRFKVKWKRKRFFSTQWLTDRVHMRQMCIKQIFCRQKSCREWKVWKIERNKKINIICTYEWWHNDWSSFMDYWELLLDCALERSWKASTQWKTSVDVIRFHFQVSRWDVSWTNPYLTC